jgi:hypothetical protein
MNWARAVIFVAISETYSLLYSDDGVFFYLAVSCDGGESLRDIRWNALFIFWNVSNVLAPVLNY